jgi:hypothetical protein
LPQAHFALGVFLGQNVAQVLPAPSQFTGTGNGKALGSAFSGFYFGHLTTPYSIYKSNIRTRLIWKWN